MKPEETNPLTRSSDHSLFAKTLLVTGFALLGATFAAQAGQGPQPPICTRARWGARGPNGCITMSSLTRAIIHHTAAPGDFNTTSQSVTAGNVRATQNYHMDTKGMCDIAYHFLVDKLGNVFEGRHNSMTGLTKGSHAGCGSVNSFGFNFMGYFHEPYYHNPPTAMRGRMYDVIAWRMPSSWSPYGTSSYAGSLHGNAGNIDTHAWVGASTSGGGCGGTACPGSVVIDNYMTYNYNGGEMRDGVNARKSPAVDNASVVSMTVPSSVTVGQTFSATVTMKNNGTTQWVDITDYKLGSQNPENTLRWGLARVSVTGTINPNQNEAFTFNCTAPTSAGSYAFDWKMLQEGVHWFGATAARGITVNGAGGEKIVDNTAAVFTGVWTLGSAAPDKYGADYRYHSTAPVSEPATYTANLTAGTHNVYAWWPQGSNRPTAAPYVISHAGGSTTVTVDQTTGGGGWRMLGTWNFNAGNNNVAVSCWTATGSMIIADAVKWH